jgi:hypothetical protein
MSRGCPVLVLVRGTGSVWSDAAKALVVGPEPGRFVLADTADPFVVRRQGALCTRADAAEPVVPGRERCRLIGSDAPDTRIVGIESGPRIHRSFLVHDYLLGPQAATLGAARRRP